jgi:GNAT superfamily N-acetyltransferase
LIALDKDGNLLGTAMLKSDSVGSELGVGPWLAAVLARPERHGKGIGTALVEAIEK